MVTQKSINDLQFAALSAAGGDMGTKIEDGLGSGREAAVNSSNELVVTSETNWERAIRLGNAHYWVSADADVVAGETLILVRNESDTKLLVIHGVHIINGNVAATTYPIHLVTTPFTAAGTVVSSINMNGNFGSASTSDVTAMHDETGNVLGTVLNELLTTAATTHHQLTSSDLPFVGLALSKGQALAIDQETESTAGQAGIYGYFIDK
jgi:hypothetical protein